MTISPEARIHPAAVVEPGAVIGAGCVVGPFALIGDDSIGRGIVETLSGSRSPAVLMKNHGPFTIGATARSAVSSTMQGF